MWFAFRIGISISLSKICINSIHCVLCFNAMSLRKAIVFLAGARIAFDWMQFTSLTSLKPISFSSRFAAIGFCNGNVRQAEQQPSISPSKLKICISALANSWRRALLYWMNIHVVHIFPNKFTKQINCCAQTLSIADIDGRISMKFPICLFKTI